MRFMVKFLGVSFFISYYIIWVYACRNRNERNQSMQMQINWLVSKWCKFLLKCFSKQIIEKNSALVKYVGRRNFWPKWILLRYFLRNLTTNSRNFFQISLYDSFYPKHFSEVASVTLSICNTLGINALEQYFYIQ